MTRVGEADAASTAEEAIRPACPDDLDAVRRCAELAYRRYVAAIGRKPAPMVADFAAQIAAGRVDIAERGGMVLGFIVAYRRADHLHVENVAVLPQWQGRGWGRRMLAHVEERARSAGIGALELYTNEKMTENLGFYPRLGFREVGRREEDGFARVFFRKELEPIPERSG